MKQGRDYRTIVISLHKEWWERMKASCLTRKQLKEYAGDSGKPLWGWHISHVREYEKPLSLSEVGMKKAPQSWCYLGGAA